MLGAGGSIKGGEVEVEDGCSPKCTSLTDPLHPEGVFYMYIAFCWLVKTMVVRCIRLRCAWFAYITHIYNTKYMHTAHTYVVHCCVRLHLVVPACCRSWTTRLVPIRALSSRCLRYRPLFLSAPRAFSSSWPNESGDCSHGQCESRPQAQLGQVWCQTSWWMGK